MTEKENWNIYRMVQHLSDHGVNDGDTYTLGGLGSGDIDGIEYVDGVWLTYFSQRGSKTNVKTWDTEHEACVYIMQRAEKLARVYGLWRE